MKNLFNRLAINSKEQILLFIKGIILGMGFIIPGVSGGTILVIFGIYEKLLSDLLKLHITPYISMGFGALFGIMSGSFIISYLFDFYESPTSAFILGCLLMSVPFMLKRTKGFSKVNIILLILGAVISFTLKVLPTMITSESLSFGQLFIAGFIASGTMMIPGVSGSAVLIILGMYEDMLNVIKGVQLNYLIVFVIGAVVGVIVLAKIFKTLFQKYQSQVLFLFSGLIIGSSRLLFPSDIDVFSIITFIVGLVIVYRWGNYKYK